MNEKKLRKSPVVIALYVLAALTLVYSFYLIGSTISYIISYYSSYSMNPEIGETVTYVLQSVYQPLIGAVLLAAAAFTLNEVRALNPAYYATDEEIAAAKAAKKEKKAEEGKFEVEIEAPAEEEKPKKTTKKAAAATEEAKPKQTRKKPAKKEEATK